MAKLKMSYPSYQQPSWVTFGTGSVRVLAECENWSDTAIFISGQEQVKNTIARSLHKSGYSLDKENMIVKPPGEPTCEMIELGAAFLDKNAFTRVVGIGGGSVMDWCRLAWAQSQGLLTFHADKAEIRAMAKKRPEFWLVPTTCGTGAEAAGIAVFSADGKKLPVVSRAFLADRVLLDGQFLNHVSSEVLAQSLCDALSHAIEAFVSIVPCNLAKEAAVSALQLILGYYPQESHPSRNDHLMEAGYLGGVAAANCSVGAIHAFAHTIAAYGISHGYANALGLIAGIYANEDVPAMQQLLKLCGTDSLAAFIERVRPVVKTAISPDKDMPLLTLLRDKSLREIISANMATDVCMRSNPKTLGTDKVYTFLDRVIETVEGVSSNDLSRLY